MVFSAVLPLSCVGCGCLCFLGFLSGFVFWGSFLVLLCLLSPKCPKFDDNKKWSFSPNSLFPGHAPFKNVWFYSQIPRVGMASSGYHRLQIRTPPPSPLSEPRIGCSALILEGFFSSCRGLLQVLQPWRPQDFPGKPLEVQGLKQSYQVTLKIIRFRKPQISCLSVPSPVPGRFHDSHDENTFLWIPVCFFMELLFHSLRWNRRILLSPRSGLRWWELGQSQAAAQPLCSCSLGMSPLVLLLICEVLEKIWVFECAGSENQNPRESKLALC